MGKSRKRKMSDLSLWADYFGTSQRQARRYADEGLICGATQKRSGHWVAPLTEANKADTAEMMRRAGEFDAESMWRDDFDVEAYLNDPPEPPRTPQETREFNRIVKLIKGDLLPEIAWRAADRLTLAVDLEAAFKRCDLDEESRQRFRHTAATCYAKPDAEGALAEARAVDEEFNALFPSDKARKLVAPCQLRAASQMRLLRLAVAMRRVENEAASSGSASDYTAQLRKQLDAITRRRCLRGSPGWALHAGDTFRPISAPVSKPALYKEFPAEDLQGARQRMGKIECFITRPTEFCGTEGDRETIYGLTQQFTPEAIAATAFVGNPLGRSVLGGVSWGLGGSIDD